MPVTLTCQRCNNPFVVPQCRAHAQFCSVSCRGRAKPLSPRGTLIHLICARCGSEFSVKPCRQHSAKYCSEACRIAPRPKAPKLDKCLNAHAGKRYGRLVVLARADYYVSPKGVRHTQVICRCDCGNEKVIKMYSIKNGDTKSCGCLHRESCSKRARERHGKGELAEGEGYLNALWATCIDGAKRRQLSFVLSREQFLDIIARPCYYCGAEPRAHSNKRARYNGGLKHNGIDRLANSDGYTPDNSVPCCRACNIAKHMRTEAEFYQWAKCLYLTVKDRQPRLL